MSKKFAVRGRGFGWKLAVAAAAVAGVVGTVWAALPSGTTEAAKVNMKASYYVNQLAELEATGKDIKDGDLRLAAAINAVPTATNFGSLGTIRVRTNSTRWDVKMTTDNGGKMLDETSVECVDVDDLDVWGNVTGQHKDCSGSTPVYLKYDNSGTPANVVLSAAIGVAKTGYRLGNTAAPATLYPMADVSGTPTFIAPVTVSLVGSEDNGGTAISFAETIGGGYDGSAPAGTFTNGIYGGAAAGVDAWGTIETDGFPTPTGNASPDLNEEFFYVNVGIPATMFDALSGNTNKKTFTETFYFELVASF
jgi:hypothetical protein